MPVVGDFFYASWGYDQTNIDFFRVVGLTPKGVRLQHWTSACAPDSERVVPGDRPAGTAIMTKLLRPDGRSTAWQSYADLYLWDGKPKYQTAPGWGH